MGIRELENQIASILKTCKTIEELRKTHVHIIKHSLTHSNFVVTKMVDVCDVTNTMDYARVLFDQVKEPNGFLFNAMIRAYTHNYEYTSAISVYKQMLLFRSFENENPVSPDKFTYPFVIKCCVGLGFYNLGKQVHAQIWRLGPMSHTIVDNALIDMYIKDGSLVDAYKVFDRMHDRDSISWNNIVSGHVKFGQMRKARAIFDSMPCRTIVSWTLMVSGYTRIGAYADSLDMFRQMQAVGIEPDDASIVSVLPACAQLGALEVGKWIYMYCERTGLLRKTHICNALVEMYSKCGCINQALQMFYNMLERDVVSWSTMIGGLANHGKAREAIEMFEKMRKERIRPNEVTFLGLLSACAHAGLCDQGQFYFDLMRKEYKLVPEIEHYGSLVDLLGRAGRVRQALEVAEKMPMKPDSKIWGSLLSSCRTHSNLEIAVIAMEHLEELEPEETGNYVLLSNICADLGKWEGVSKMRKLIRSKSMKKTPGCSSVEVNNVVQEFVSGDDSKPFSDELFCLLELLSCHCNTSDGQYETVPEDLS